MVSRAGMSIRFTADDKQLRPMGRSTSGVQGMRLRQNDEVLSMNIIPEDSTKDLLLITDQGFGKKTTLTEYRLQGRNGYGVKAIAMSKERGALVGALVLDDDDQIMAIMKSGKVIRFDVSEINRTGRSTQGVTIAKPDDDDQIVEITLAEKKPQINKQ